MIKKCFDYHYGTEADTYSFYRIPKSLFTDSTFTKLSCESKLLYGLMLDRMGLSIKNGWLDKENRVYIYFTLDDVQESLGCGHDKAVKLFAELDDVKGIGLIERVKQGLGKPCIIYVKNCIISESASELQTSEKPKSGKSTHPTATSSDSIDCKKTELWTSEKSRSGLRENRSADFEKPACNKTEYIKPDINKTELSINPVANEDVPTFSKNRMDRITAYREIVAENISCELLLEQFTRESVEGILDLLTDTLCSEKQSIRIAGEDMPLELVRSRLLKLNHSHLEYVFECFDNNTTKIHNIRSYLLTALYHAPETIEPYFQAEANYDMAGSG